MTLALLAILFSFLTCAYGTKLYFEHAKKIKLVDTPNARSSHTTVTPNGGGIIFFLVYLIALSSLYTLGFVEASFWLTIIIGGSLVAITGFIDDVKNLSATTRLLIQFLAVSWGIFNIGSIQISGLAHSILFEALITFLGIIWIINFYNFLDGIDGYAGHQTLFICFAIGLLAYLHSDFGMIYTLAAFFACILGFLIWNHYPAKVFMGDAGSNFIGYVIGILLVFTVSNGLVSIPQWLILLSLFWVDGTVALTRRVIKKQRFWEAHCTHAYQHLAKRYSRHDKVCRLQFIVNYFWLCPLCLLCSQFPKFEVMITFIALAPIFGMVMVLGSGVEREPNHLVPSMDSEISKYEAL